MDSSRKHIRCMKQNRNRLKWFFLTWRPSMFDAGTDQGAVFLEDGSMMGSERVGVVFPGWKRSFDPRGWISFHSVINVIHQDGANRERERHKESVLSKMMTDFPDKPYLRCSLFSGAESKGFVLLPWCIYDYISEYGCHIDCLGTGFHVPLQQSPALLNLL